MCPEQTVTYLSERSNKLGQVLYQLRGRSSAQARLLPEGAIDRQPLTPPEARPWTRDFCRKKAMTTGGTEASKPAAEMRG